MSTTMTLLLQIQNLKVYYGPAQALFGLDLAVAPGETVALVGAKRGRALMAKPRLLLLDEPSLGLAPLITDDIFDQVHFG